MNDILQSLYFHKTAQVVAPQGDAYISAPCPGLDHCPHQREEEDEQARFERATGICCCKGAREALRYLLDEGHFDRKQLALAWRTRALWWDPDQNRLRAVPSVVEEVTGAVVVVIGVLALMIFGVVLILPGPDMTLREGIALGGQLLVYVLAAPVAAHFLIRPNAIVRRARAHVRRYYAGRRG